MVLTADQFYHVICVVVKASIVINKMQVFACNLCQNQTVFRCLSLWTNSNDYHSVT